MDAAVQHEPQSETSRPAGAGRPVGQVRFTRTYRHPVKGKNINEKTLLATDYLNHFNEEIMLIGMVASMPECLEDAKAWQPKSYQQHFRDSGFSDKELAIEAYEHAPPEYRAPFDVVIERLNAAVATGVSEIEIALSGDQMVLDALCASVGADLQALVDKASAIINGYAESLDQTAIDELMDDDPEHTVFV